MNTHFSKASFYKNLVALHSYLKQIRLINGQRVTRPTCFVVSCSVAAGKHTKPCAHTHFTRNKEASAIHLPETRLCASTEQKTTSCSWWPGLLFIWKSCGRAASPSTAQPKGEGCMRGEHAYRCCASGQRTSRDDNHNADDDKGGDSEERCLSEHLTPNSPLESYNRPPHNDDESSLCAIIPES